MIDIKTIKLIIWDLDDTFWTGTLSEGPITPVTGNIDLVRELTDHGIINSICSKNDFEETKQKLIELKVWEYFVFVSINWENKAVRIKSIIDQMALRPCNVLFIDDNTFNLQEAKHLLPDLQVSMPDEVINELRSQIPNVTKNDYKHTRLKQYKVLEEKAEASTQYNSSEEFLYATGIKVKMSEVAGADIESDNDLFKRLHELVLRTNQLNYTKVRSTEDELSQILRNNGNKCGYVTVEDKFGKYGIVGFYALEMESNRLIHFLFSCRTMGQKIEQWVYAELGFPNITVVGEVRTKLNDSERPGWINQTATESDDDTHLDFEKKRNAKVLIKGPCDLNRARMYISNVEGIDVELTYVRDRKGQSVYYHNHSASILNLLLSDAEKDSLSSDLGYIDRHSLNSSFFTGNYDVIFLSTLLECNLAVYKNKSNHNKSAVVGYLPTDITDERNYKYLEDEGFDNYLFSEKELKAFSEMYEYVGRTTPDSYVVFLDKVLDLLPSKTTLCLILGATKFFPTDDDRVAYHFGLNSVIKKYASSNKRVRFIDVDEGIANRSDYTEHIDHYQAKVYYYIATEMNKVMEEVVGEKSSFNVRSSALVKMDSFLNDKKKYFKTDGRFYRGLRSFYWKLTGRPTNHK